MSESIKKYIMITSTILLVLINLGISWLYNFQWQIVFVFAYFTGLCNGLIVAAIENYNE